MEGSTLMKEEPDEKQDQIPVNKDSNMYAVHNISSTPLQQNLK